MIRIKQFVIALWVAMLLGSSVGGWGAEKPRYVSLTILHTNDIHGHVFPVTYDSSAMPGIDVGGAARRAQLTRQIKSRLSGQTIVMDAGDLFTRGPIGDFKGVPDFDVANAIPYDIMTLGNNEFKGAGGLNGQQIMFDRIKQAHFPIVCANAFYESNGQLIVPAYKVLERNGIKVGIFGLTAPRVASYAQAKGLIIKDPITVAKQILPELQKQCDFVVALTHIGYDLDQKLAAEVPEIDVIIGGDSHTWLPQPVLVPHSNRSDKALEIPGTLICQDGDWGRALGELDLRLRLGDDQHYNVMSYSGRLISIDSSIKPADDVTQILKNDTLLAAKVRGHLDNAVSKSEIPNWVAQTLQKTGKAQIIAIKKNLFEDGLPAGELTDLDFRRMMPFADKVVVASVTGKQLRSLITEVPVVLAGASQDGSTISVGGQPVNDSETYTLCLTDYHAASLKALSGVKLTDSGLMLREAVAQSLGDASVKSSNKKVLPEIHNLVVRDHGQNYLFDACMQYLMESLHENKEYDYWFFSGVTGDSFTQLYRLNNQDSVISLSQDDFGYDVIKRAFDACGYDFTYVTQAELKADKAKWTKKIVDSLDTGTAVITYGYEDKGSFVNDFTVICGYENNGENLFFMRESDKDPLIKSSKGLDYSKGLVFAGKKKQAPSLAEVYRTAVEKIPSYMTLAPKGSLVFGKQAFDAWADGLCDGKTFDGQPNEKMDELRWVKHNAFLCIAGTNGCSRGFLEKALALNPDMTFITQIQPSFEKMQVTFEAICKMQGDFMVPYDMLKNAESRKQISDKVREFNKYYDEILKIMGPMKSLKS